MLIRASTNESENATGRGLRFSLSHQRGEGRGEGWTGGCVLFASERILRNHPSPSIPLPVEGRGKSHRRRETFHVWRHHKH